MSGLIERFQALPDYREVKITRNHPGEILLLSLMAILSGADGFGDIAEWMRARKREIERFFGHHFSVPAYTTIRNVFLRIDRQALERLHREWSREILSREGRVLSIVAADGKRMRGSHNRALNEPARHIVSLFLPPEDKLVLAQEEVDSKRNEIPALLELLEDLDLEGCILTMDAMHTQKKHFRRFERKGPIIWPRSRRIRKNSMSGSSIS